MASAGRFLDRASDLDPVRPREGEHLILGAAARPAEVAGGTSESLHRLAGREDDHGLGLLVRLVADGVLEPGADRDDACRDRRPCV